MKPVHELLRENFERWEMRGRGVLTFPDRVSPRPPFAAFPGHRLKEFQSGDDGVRHTAVSGLFARLGEMIRGQGDAQHALSNHASEEQLDENHDGRRLDAPAHEQEANDRRAKTGEQDGAQREASRQPGHEHEDDDFSHHAERPEQADLGLRVAVGIKVDRVKNVERPMRPPTLRSRPS